MGNQWSKKERVKTLHIQCDSFLKKCILCFKSERYTWETIWNNEPLYNLLYYMQGLIIGIELYTPRHVICLYLPFFINKAIYIETGNLGESEPRYKQMICTWDEFRPRPWRCFPESYGSALQGYCGTWGGGWRQCNCWNVFLVHQTRNQPSPPLGRTLVLFV